jgi:hypothetical protein
MKLGQWLIQFPLDFDAQLAAAQTVNEARFGEPGSGSGHAG